MLLCLLLLAGLATGSSVGTQHVGYRHGLSANQESVLGLQRAWNGHAGEFGFLSSKLMILRLRGGSADLLREYDEEMMGKDLDQIHEDMKEAKALLADSKDPLDKILRYSPRGLPMTEEPNCEVYPNNYYDNWPSESENDPNDMTKWIPDENDLAELEEAVKFTRKVAEDLSPEGIENILHSNGLTLDDLQPRLNSLGTTFGNLTKIEEMRQRVITRADDVLFTKELLTQRMAANIPSPAEELKAELAQMTEADIHPAIKLLHEWQKNKKEEHETGDFMRQYRAHRAKGIVEVEPIPTEPVLVDKETVPPLPASKAPEVSLDYY